MPYAHPRWGLEFDWLAADRDRRVARFSSSGYGPVPASVLERVADIDAAVELTDYLPVIGLAIEVPAELSGDYGAWMLMSSRGLYAYDWFGHHGPYRRIAVPTVPLRTVDLPARLLDAVELVALPLSFAEAVDISFPYANENPS
jgi:hypothetical protein